MVLKIDIVGESGTHSTLERLNTLHGTVRSEGVRKYSCLEVFLQCRRQEGVSRMICISMKAQFHFTVHILESVLDNQAALKKIQP